MKKLFIITTLLFFMPLTIEKYQRRILAAEKEATASAETEVDERIKGIKEGVAEKVAKLKLLQNRAFSGRIDSLDEKSFYLETKMGEMILVQINEATTISLKVGAKNQQATLDKLRQDEQVIIWGRYNSEEKSLSAQKIISRQLPQSFIGQTENIDIDNNRLTIRQLLNNQPITVDIDKINTIHQLDKNDDFVKKRLKDLNVNDTVYIYGFDSQSAPPAGRAGPPAGEAGLFEAHRLLIINAAFPSPPAE